jgi:hypothetical protein
MRARGQCRSCAARQRCSTARLARPPAWLRSIFIAGNSWSATYCRRETSIVTAVVGAGPTWQYDILIRWTQTGDDDPAASP